MHRRAKDGGPDSRSRRSADAGAADEEAEPRPRRSTTRASRHEARGRRTTTASTHLPRAGGSSSRKTAAIRVEEKESDDEGLRHSGRLIHAQDREASANQEAAADRIGPAGSAMRGRGGRGSERDRERLDGARGHLKLRVGKT